MLGVGFLQFLARLSFESEMLLLTQYTLSLPYRSSIRPSSVVVYVTCCKHFGVSLLRQHRSSIPFYLSCVIPTKAAFLTLLSKKPGIITKNPHSSLEIHLSLI